MCTCNYKKFNTPFEFRAISWAFLKKRTKHILPELFSTFNMKRMIYRAIFQFILLVYPFHPLNKCIQDIMVSTAKYIRFALTMHIFMVIFFFDWFLLHNTLNQSTESPKVLWVMTLYRNGLARAHRWYCTTKTYDWIKLKLCELKQKNKQFKF